MNTIPWQKRQVTKKRLNKMCKYFRGKKVTICYEYNNSIGANCATTWTGEYDSYSIRSYKCIYGSVNIETVFYCKELKAFSFHIDSIDCAEFTGVGKIKILNDGPYCYFSIKRVY